MSLKGKYWTNLMIEAEIDVFDTVRIVNEHNELLNRFNELHQALHQANGLRIRMSDKCRSQNSKLLDKCVPYLPG